MSKLSFDPIMIIGADWIAQIGRLLQRFVCPGAGETPKTMDRLPAAIAEPIESANHPVRRGRCFAIVGKNIAVIASIEHRPDYAGGFEWEGNEVVAAHLHSHCRDAPEWLLP